MQNDMSRLQRLGEVMTTHGKQMVLALIVLIVGLLVARLITKGLRKILPPTQVSSIICNCVYILLVAIVVTAAAVEFGAQPINMLRLLTIVALVASGCSSFSGPSSPPCRLRSAIPSRPAICSARWKP
jgi:small conductance mechanosensitive channel